MTSNERFEALVWLGVLRALSYQRSRARTRRDYMREYMREYMRDYRAGRRRRR